MNLNSCYVLPCPQQVSACCDACCPGVCVAVAPPGFRMISSMVAPCGKGTFSSSYSDNYVPCTRCSTVKGPGITTETAGAISVDRCTCERGCDHRMGQVFFTAAAAVQHCSEEGCLLSVVRQCTSPPLLMLLPVLRPLVMLHLPLPRPGVEQGYAAAGDSGLIYLAGAPAGSAIASAKPCPQDHYCSGGSPYEGGSGVPKRCPNGLRTQSQGAVSVDQCGESVLHCYFGMLNCCRCVLLASEVHCYCGLTDCCRCVLLASEVHCHCGITDCSGCVLLASKVCC